MAFIDDIQSRDTVLFPVVIFNISNTGDDINISTKSAYGSENVYNYSRTYAPLLLSSPSIKS